ncbi:hypothetical protein C2W62_08070 [Candidatus Entotheonella serta]|nr:hypothetical protein C2W62_08070 [Candidatus Entotheonella serta]
MVWSSQNRGRRCVAARYVGVAIAVVSVFFALAGRGDAVGRGSGSTRIDGVTVTDTHVVTHHDRVPRACASPTVVARHSGGWSQTTIWSTGHVPETDAAVLIPSGTTVTYDVSQMVKLRCIEVQGRLRFGNRNALLHVSNLQVLPSGSLVIGTAGQPIAPGLSGGNCHPGYRLASENNGASGPRPWTVLNRFVGVGRVDNSRCTDGADLYPFGARGTRRRRADQAAVHPSGLARGR